MITETAEQYYRIPDWSAGYLRAAENGELRLFPTKNPDLGISLKHLTETLRKAGHRTPVSLHFPQIIDYAVSKLCRSFEQAAAEFGYSGRYAPIYPVKVNQYAPVVDAVHRAGKPWDIGLEAGSKAELAAILSRSQTPRRIICNGYKDRDYIRMAVQAASRQDMFVVIEKFSELDLLFQVLDETGTTTPPLIGIRARLHTRGTGKWEESGGDFAKFGLTAAEILAACDRLREAGLLDRLNMLHVHIGSQITHSAKVKSMVFEAGMLYAELYRDGIPLSILDFGGGLGVDYDGSRSSGAASINYTMTEYANNLVFHLKDVCAQKEVPEPDIFTESGRAMVAFHAMVVVDAFEQHSLFSPMPFLDTDWEREKVLFDLKDTYDSINTRNLWEYFHDAVHMREQLHTLFGMGSVSLREKAAGEQIFWNIARKTFSLAHRVDSRPEELERIQGLMATKYVTNFSIFQSIPDAWAIHHLFPIVPLQRLNELPGEHATLADITCDSDGKINRFVDVGQNRQTLRLHRLKDQRYDLGVFLTGAYQQTMGNPHNLFGRPESLFIRVTGPDTYEIDHIIPGDRVSDQLERYGYDPETFTDNWDSKTARTLLDSSTYLDRIPAVDTIPSAVPITVLYRIPQLDCDRCRMDLERLLADLPMVSAYFITGDRARISVPNADTFPHLEVILKDAGFEPMEEPDRVDR